MISENLVILLNLIDALEFYKPKLVLSNQLAVSSDANAGVTQTTQFLLLPGLPSEVNVLQFRHFRQYKNC